MLRSWFCLPIDEDIQRRSIATDSVRQKHQNASAIQTHVVRIRKHSRRLRNPEERRGRPELQSTRNRSDLSHHQHPVQRAIEKLFSVPAPARETSAGTGYSPAGTADRKARNVYFIGAA